MARASSSVTSRSAPTSWTASVRCSGTHLGKWLGHPPTGRRFAAIDEVGIYHVRDGRIVETWGIEDTLGRLEQLGLR